MKRSALMRLLLASVLAATALVAAGEPATGQLDVKVTDGIGDPLTGATVAVGHGGDFSLPQPVNLEGIATFALLPGAYNVQVVVPNVVPKEKPADITVGETTKLGFAFPRAEKGK